MKMLQEPALMSYIFHIVVYFTFYISRITFYIGTWFNMILSVAKKSRCWRGKLGSLVTIQVVLEEIDSLKMCKHVKLTQFSGKS